MKFKTWLAGLIQAFLLVCLTLLLNITFLKIHMLNSYPYYGSVNTAFFSTLTLVRFVSLGIVYGLALLGYPLYLFTVKRGLEGLKTLAYTALFLILFFVTAQICIYLFVKQSGIKQLSPTTMLPISQPISQEEAIRRSQETKARLEKARLEYEEKQSLENTAIPKSLSDEGVTIGPVENKIYPYVININTGERILLEELEE